ncbi:hypothetical protein [Streptomyces reniochalinae]|uniref:Uncharacterized protein n=1 Tax=Streptomyces reniochalinae TaxID=2250578 RepID=A0A367E944_9ACTN|nr:hypothetical protein [Streptomyces reniochalinae]RCG14185.1 hypothetical protein DQ392_29090 [Streptomyces reniochalinae]
MDPTRPRAAGITLMAAGELRDALAAIERGDRPAAVAALMAIDPDSWQAIEHRLAALGGSVSALLTIPTPTDD